MVRLFQKSGKKNTANFKFNTSLHLKNLPLEEYAHVIYAFYRGLTELNNFLKESLLEDYISFGTFDRISKELKIVKFRQCKIPNIPSIKTLFYSKAVELKPTEPDLNDVAVPILSEVPKQEVISGLPSTESKLPVKSLPPIRSGSPTIPKISFSQTEAKSVLGSKTSPRESDRATGIAILRRQMSDELKKIRTILPKK